MCQIRPYVLIAAGVLFSAAVLGAAAPDSRLLTGARVLDATGERFLEGAAVLVEDGRVTAVGAGVDAPAEVPRLDLAGLFVVPGLIDLHTHLLLRPYDEMSWNDQVLKEQLELRTIRATVAARATLEAGFTTIRELGTEGAGYADVALRDAVSAALEAGSKNILVDLGGVSTIDSSGIGELVSAYTTVSNRGGKLKLYNLPDKVTDILQITQLISVFEVFDDEGEAVASFGGA